MDDELKLAFRQGGDRFVERRFQNARDLVNAANTQHRNLLSLSIKVLTEFGIVS